MKKLLLLALCGCVAPSIASAVTITAIYGGGNPDIGWTTGSGPGDLLLGLRAKNRDNGATPVVGSTYTFATPLASNPARAIFNYEFSISTGSVLNASGYDFYLSADLDSSAGTSFFTIDPLAVYGDNSYGTFGVTANGAGVEGNYATYGGTKNFVQNSQNIAFLGMPVNVPDATYSYELYAVQSGAGATGTRLASVGITVKVGQGGASVPDSGSSILLVTLGIAGLVGLRSRLRAK